MAVKFANNAVSTLAAPLDSGDTSLTINTADQSRFPAAGGGDWYPLTLIDLDGNMEIVRATARSGAIITIVRGQEGTSARSFTTGSRVGLRLTRAALETLATQAALDALALAVQGAIDGLGDLASKDTVGTNDIDNLAVTNAKLRNSAAVSIMGRSANSAGAVDDIVAASNDTFLRRVSNALGFGKATIGMLSDVMASQAEAEAGTANDKLMTPLRGAEQIAALVGSYVKPPKITKITSTGTFSKDPAAKLVRVLVQGAGGGGGGSGSSANTQGGHGSAGMFVDATFDTSVVPSSLTATIGARGTGSGGGTNQAGSGGTTSFGSLVSCPGGNGGFAINTASSQGPSGDPAAAPTISSSALIYEIDPGQFTARVLTNNAMGGLGGGDSHMGIGGAPVGNQTPGNDGTGYGSGGSGARNGPSGGGTRNGGDGTPGVIYVLEYFT